LEGLIVGKGELLGRYTEGHCRLSSSRIDLPELAPCVRTAVDLAAAYRVVEVSSGRSLHLSG
jgi:hypothetical protein